MGKPIIRLYDLAGTGLIIDYPSGLIYSNQAGGHSCMQPELEGAFVPIGNDVALEGNELLSADHALREYFVGPKHQGMGACDGLDPEDADFIEREVNKVLGSDCIRVDRQNLRASMEAWVWVTCEPCSQFVGSLSIANGLGSFPLRGVLTWCNSD